MSFSSESGHDPAADSDFLWPTADNYKQTVYRGLFPSEQKWEEWAQTTSEPFSDDFLFHVSRSISDDLNNYLLKGDLKHPMELKFREENYASTQVGFVSSVASGLVTLLLFRKGLFRNSLLLGSAFFMLKSKWLQHNVSSSMVECRVEVFPVSPLTTHHVCPLHLSSVALPIPSPPARG